VDISVTICLFVFLCVCMVTDCACTVTDFSAEDKANGVKFCMVVHRRPGQAIAHFGVLCSLLHQKLPQKPTALDVPKRIFAVYVSIMGLTRCYKTRVFLHLYLQVFY